MTALKEKYLKALNKVDSINLCIVGQDPYPNGANGIAFCKDDFDQFFDESCCGKDVLESLGYDEGWIRSNYESPVDLFFKLLDKGIAFINVSHTSFRTANITNFTEDQPYNNSFLEKSKNIILLGTGITKRHFEEYYSGFKETETVCHPSNKVKESYPKKWAEIWGTTYLTKFK